MSSIKKRKSARQAAAKASSPRSLEQFLKLPTKRQQTLTSVAHALTAMRSEGLSLAKAARAYQVDPRTVVRQAGAGLRKNTYNRYVPRPSDGVLRAMVLPTERGLAEIAIRGSRDATTLGKYWAAVQTFLETGDDSALRPFHGQSITDASGKRVSLLTDLDQLERLGSAGALSFESIYAKVA